MFALSLLASACASGAEMPDQSAPIAGSFGPIAGGVHGASGVGATAGQGGHSGAGSAGVAAPVAGQGASGGDGASAGIGAAGMAQAGSGGAGDGASGAGNPDLPQAGAGSAGTGTAGTGTAGTGTAGMGTAGMGAAGMGTGGVAMPEAGMGAAGMGAAGMGGEGGGEPPPPASPFPAASDFTRGGSFRTTSEAGGFTCTIYRPRTLGEDDRKHPVIVWGNGTLNTPSSYDALFEHFASHGFIVAAANTSSSGSGREMIACLDYILEQNAASGAFQDKVDTHRIAAAGYSQGGAGTLMAGRDPRFVATAAIAPYVIVPLGGFSYSSVRQQVHPMFMISGGSDLVAVPRDNQQQIFDTAPVPIVWAALAGAGHLEVLGNGGGFRGPLTAWFRYRLMDDEAAADWFTKTPCTLCSQRSWNVLHNDRWMD